MPTYTNTANSTNPSVALGSPTLTGTDIVRFNEAGSSYTTNLTSLGSTAIAEFYIDDPFAGDVGDGSSGMVIQADDMYIGGHSPNSVALTGLGSGTVDLLHWELKTAAVGFLNSYADITKLRMISGGTLTVMGDTVIDDANIAGVGSHMVFENGTALDKLRVVGRGCKATLKRDVTTSATIIQGTMLCEDATATPTVVNNYGGLSQLLGGTIAITCGGDGTVIDFSKATADCVITWTIIGNTKIIKPPTGVAMNVPTDAQILGGKVTIV